MRAAALVLLLLGAPAWAVDLFAIADGGIRPDGVACANSGDAPRGGAVMRALLLFLGLCILAPPSWAACGATCFVDLSGAGTGAKNGVSVSDQCAGASDSDCAPVNGTASTIYLCGTGSADIRNDVSGTFDARITYDAACPGGVAGTFTDAQITGSGVDYWGVKNLTINGTGSTNKSGIACFVCETSKLGSGACLSHEGTCTGFRAQNNTIDMAGKSGIEIGTTIDQSSYSQTKEVIVTGNRITSSGAHGIALNANIVRPTVTDNYISGSNRTGANNSWGLYTSPRAVSKTGGWVDPGQTCAAGGANQFKITLGSGVTAIGATESLKEVIFANLANGHYAQQVIGSCGIGGAGITGNRRWCQTGSEIHVCGTGSELNTLAAINATQTVYVASDYGPAVFGPRNEITTTSNDGGADDGAGFGPDIGSRNVAFVGNYSHHNQGRGSDFNMCSANCVASGNILTNNGTYGFLVGVPANSTDVVSFYNNTIWANGAEPFRMSAVGTTAVQAYDNLVGGTPGVNCTNVALGGGEGGNNYRNCTDTNLPTATNLAPGWVGGDSPTTADGFCLGAESALLSAGTYIGAYVGGYNGESLTNPPPVGARGLCQKRAPSATRTASAARIASGVRP